MVYFVRRALLVGVLLFASQFVFSLAFLTTQSIMGVQDPRFAEIFKQYFLRAAAWMELKILLAYAAVGAGLALACAIPFLLDPAFTARKPAKRWVAFLSLLSALDLGFLARDIRIHPQNYTEFLYDKGGLLRQVQILLTDRLPAWVVHGLPWVILGGLAATMASYLAFRHPRKTLAGAGVVGLIALAPHRSAKVMPNEGPNVILIAIDSFRSDRLFSPITPRISRLAEDGVVFLRAYPDVARTFPSMVTIHTGRYALRHGIREMFPSREQRDRIGVSLPRFLRDRGYETAVTADYAGDIFPRVDLGFDRIDCPDFTAEVLMEQRSLETHPFLLPYVSNRPGMKLFPALREFTSLSEPDALADRADEMIARLSQSPRFFLTIFFSSPHFPYSAPDPYYRQFTDPSYRGPYKYHKANRIDLVEETLTADDRSQVRGLYDGALFGADKAAGALIRRLQESPVGANTLIVVTADHGENLYEEGWMGHGDELWNEEGIRVPLVFLGAGLTPRKIDAVPVSLASLAPTLVEWLGFPLDDYGLTDGKSLAPALRGGLVPSDPIYLETGAWFAPNGSARFHRERIPYASLLDFTEMDPDHRFEIIVRPEYEAIINGSKHRAVMEGDRRLVYKPLREGPRYDLLKIQGYGAQPLLDAAEGLRMRADLRRMVKEIGRETLWRGNVDGS